MVACWRACRWGSLARTSSRGGSLHCGRHFALRAGRHRRGIYLNVVMGMTWCNPSTVRWPRHSFAIIIGLVSLYARQRRIRSLAPGRWAMAIGLIFFAKNAGLHRCDELLVRDILLISRHDLWLSPEWTW